MAVLMAVSYELIEALSIIFQISHIRSRQSVFGLSYDFVYWTLLSCLNEAIYWGLMSTDFAQTQSKNRYSSPPVSHGASITFNIGQLMLYGLVAYTALCKLNHTRDPFQGVSTWTLTISVIFLLVAVHLFVFSSIFVDDNGLGYRGFMWLDFVNWFWATAKFGEIVRFVPQLALNFKLMSTKGLSYVFIVLNCGASVAAMLLTMVTRPFLPNAINVLLYGFKALSIAGILFQFRLYGSDYRRVQKDNDEEIQLDVPRLDPNNRFQE
ncbi:hypothetical protein TRVA0_001S03950 [Trichomonascus vanleenenianus]|uniref:uncharacterized protein n=1 Tax=Trichomonascus vanleenenianus TaxID=2268995 RepID=UPI003ECAC057